jgi:hypothetical protein
MKNIKSTLYIGLLSITSSIQAQPFAEVSGQVADKGNFMPLAGVIVRISGSESVYFTDSSGQYRIEKVKAGSYNISFSLEGYSDVTRYNVVLTSGNINVLNVELEPTMQTVGTVTVRTTRRTARAATLETPLSVQRLTIEEIKSNPGGNFDISRVVQSLPGVGGTAGSVGGFRNDLIIRGGAPNENVYYLDGVEIPQINHFATQGSAGGPSGILNVSFIEDVKLSSSAFDAGFDNTLSSVLDFKQKKGNKQRLQGNVRMSATEFATTLDGPLGKNTTFLASARRSYLQFLFQALDRPIRPNYWDFQYTVNHKINAKSSITFLGVGAIDEFSFAVPSESTPEKTYILNSNPNINQWNYTTGMAYRRSLPKGSLQIALSRNMLDNSLRRFEDNLNPTSANQSLDVQSQESENKLRVQVNETRGAWKLSYGGVLQYVRFDNRGFARVRAAIRDTAGNMLQPELRVNLDSRVAFFRSGLHAQAGRRFLGDRLGASFGMRIDGNSFTDQGMRMWEQFSPRLSLSYVLAPRFNLNGSIGRYYKLPPYTTLGFRNQTGALLNRDSRYIRSDHYVLGLEFLPTATRRFTLEGFYKNYSHVPISVRDGISLSNRGGDFNILGNEDISSTGLGRAYGLEFFAQQKLTRKMFGILSYTLFYSEYTGADGLFRPSAWDSRHLLSLTWGYKFPRNWELGLKFRYQGGAPFTPFDETASRLNYLSTGEGVLDLSRLNTARLRSFHASDVRIDKKWNLKGITIDLFLDVSNWYVAPSPAYPQYTFQRTADNSAFATTNGAPIVPDGSNAVPLILSNNDPTVLPTIGFIVEF